MFSSSPASNSLDASSTPRLPVVPIKKDTVKCLLGAKLHLVRITGLQDGIPHAQLCLTLCDPMECNLPGSSVQGLLRQDYWSGVAFPTPGDFSDPGIKPGSPALQADFLPSEPLCISHTLWNLVLVITLKI